MDGQLELLPSLSEESGIYLEIEIEMASNCHCGVVEVQRVVAEAMAVNTASRRVMEKSGLRLVRTFHQPWPFPIEGDEFGDVEYALDKTTWQQGSAHG